IPHIQHLKGISFLYNHIDDSSYSTSDDSLICIRSLNPVISKSLKIRFDAPVTRNTLSRLLKSLSVPTKIPSPVESMYDTSVTSILTWWVPSCLIGSSTF